MYVYNYRLFDRYNRVVVSLAVLGDERATWRPNRFSSGLWGCQVDFRFPIAKVIDWADREAELETSKNPFATVVLAHLKTQQTRGDKESRRDWKFRLVRGLYERGFEGVEIRRLFRFIDWLMDLPADLESSFLDEIYRFEEQTAMPYVTSAERFGFQRGLKEGLEKGREEGLEKGREEGLEKGREEGLEKGREQGHAQGIREGLLQGIETALEVKFGPAALAVFGELRKLEDVARLSAIRDAIKTATSLDDLRPLWSQE